MDDRSTVSPPDPAETDDPETPHEDAGPGQPDLSALPIAGITRRRVGFLVSALVSAWIVIVFARQVGDASSAGVKVEALQSSNAELAGRVAALQREAALIQRQEWIVQQARGHGLGDSGEIPFALATAPALPPDAPGSAAVRLGGRTERVTPLEAWLSLIIGPSR